MAHVHCIFSLTLALLVVVMCQANKSSPVPASGGGGTGSQSKAPPREASKPGALTSFAKMLIDIPLGIVEALKDGAEGIESVIVGFMKSIFK